MFTSLPDFTPRDPHSLWYTSSRNPFIPPGPPDNQNADPSNNHHGTNQSRQRTQLFERTMLARLAADEQKMEHRRASVQNFGSKWLRPPGVPKTLHQMREEKREQEEHQEAMRREQLAQELAEAEAEGGMTEDGMDDVQLDGAQDLDDEIPDADDDFALGGDDSDEDEEDDEDEDGEEDGEEEDADEEALREEHQHNLMAARMRMTDDAFREALIRGDPEGDDMYGGEEELEEESHGHILDEDDFAYDGAGINGVDMDANLDDEIPEAEEGGYEHTDSEAELSSSSEEEEEDEEQEEQEDESNLRGDVDDDDDDDEEEGEDEDEDTSGLQDMSFAPPRTAATLEPPQSPSLRARMGLPSPAGRPSMDLSGLLSHDESSFMMESSPARGRGKPRRR